MSVIQGKKASPLLLLLFLIAIAVSISLSKTSLDNRTHLTQVEEKEEDNSKSIDAIEIYKVNPHKQSSIINHWYFRDSESLKIIESILKNESSKSTSAPPIEAEYKIILSYNNSEIAVYPLWLENKSDNAIIESESYKLITSSGTEKLKALIASP